MTRAVVSRARWPRRSVRARLRRCLPASLCRDLLLSALVLSAGLGSTPAHAQLFGSEGLDPTFCKLATVRETVVYVDDTMMTDGQTAWATSLMDKLRATLTPGELVTVVRLSPAGTGSSQEVWHGCWPALSDADRARAAHGIYIFKANPASQIDTQQRFFARDFGGALTRIYLAAKRPEAETRIDPAQPPHKDIVRALASDGGRFADASRTIRAILYSDLAENSDLFSVFRPPPVPFPDLGARLGTYLRHGVFYDYGLATDIASGGPEDLPERTRADWRAALRAMAAVPAGMGSDLNVPNVLPVTSATYSVSLAFGSDTLDGKLALLAGSDGELVDSWIGISRLPDSGVTGTFRCAEAAGGTRCRIDGATTSGVATSSQSETVSLAGPATGPLTGHLGVPGTQYLYKLTATRAD